MTASTLEPTTLHTSEEAAERAGVTFRQLDYWVTQGIVTPTEWLNEGGSGSRRRWSDEDITRIATAAELKDLGLSGALIAIAVQSNALWLGIADGLIVEQLNSGDDLVAFVGRHFTSAQSLAIVQHMKRARRA